MPAKPKKLNWWALLQRNLALGYSTVSLKKKSVCLIEYTLHYSLHSIVTSAKSIHITFVRQVSINIHSFIAVYNLQAFLIILYHLIGMWDPVIHSKLKNLISLILECILNNFTIQIAF